MSGERTGPRVAYVMSRFPKVTETFILFEMIAVEEAGASVELFPLLREHQPVQHPEAAPFVARGHFFPFVSWPIVRSNLRWLRRDPRRYLAALWAMLRGTWGSLNFFVGGLGIFPKVVHASGRMVELGVDHVHCHFASHPALAGLLVHRLTGLPFSFVAHGSDLHVDRHMLPQKVEAAAFVCAISAENRRVILEECGLATGRDHAASGALEAKVEVLHCGVDTARFTPPDEDDTGAERFVVTCIGTLHEVKGQRHLVAAMARLAGEGVAAELVFVGDGPDRAALEAQAAEAGIAHLVRFTGLVPRDEVIAQVQRSSVVVAPSVPTRGGKREGIPVVLMEAMAAARPVVASRLSGIPELVEDGVTGLLTPPGDDAALAAAIRRLHDDPALRRQLGGAARTRVIEAFDVRGNARRLLDLIAAAGAGR